MMQRTMHFKINLMQTLYLALGLQINQVPQIIQQFLLFRLTFRGSMGGGPMLPQIKTGSRTGKATVITGSPYRDTLTTSLSRVRASNRPIGWAKRPLEVEPAFKKKEPPLQKFPKKQKIGSLRKTDSNLCDDTSSDGSSEEECIYCTQPYKNDKNGEAWMRCVQCLRWAHELCAGIPDENDWKTFKCEICLKRKDSFKKKMLK